MKLHFLMDYNYISDKLMIYSDKHIVISIIISKNSTIKKTRISNKKFVNLTKKKNNYPLMPIGEFDSFLSISLYFLFLFFFLFFQSMFYLFIFLLPVFLYSICFFTSPLYFVLFLKFFLLIPKPLYSLLQFQKGKHLYQLYG